MFDHLVMRLVEIPKYVDAELGELARKYNVSKGDLIRGALRTKLDEWREDTTGTKMLEDVASGRRTAVTQKE